MVYYLVPNRNDTDKKKRPIFDPHPPSNILIPTLPRSQGQEEVTPSFFVDQTLGLKDKNLIIFYNRNRALHRLPQFFSRPTTPTTPYTGIRTGPTIQTVLTGIPEGRSPIASM
uniref:Uncharacterized protein n=1 Tax=Picea glauca TaxID=3330 RepID=A0A101LZX8_PICGL|nr:hypothetical protein ABT39_MTgene4496 [Picea glauca]QHR87405.1 hypothetical protein Q903MT_gene1415 [Picea sitchensis]